MGVFGQLKAFLHESAVAGLVRQTGPYSPSARPFNLLRSFALLSLFVIGVIGVVSALVILRYQREHIMERDATVTAELVQSLAQSELSFPHADGLNQGHRLAELFAHVANIPHVLRANIFSADGKVIWSTDERIIGRRFADNTQLDRALHGELVYGLIRRGPGDKTEHAFVPDGVSEFVETYVPVRDPLYNKIVGVVEVYKVPKALAGALAKGRYLIWGGGVIGAVFLYLTLFWIVYRADRVIRTQRRQLEEEIAEHKRDKHTLRRSEHALRVLSTKLLGAQEQERKRIAGELHEGLGQSLSAIKFNLERGLKALESCAEQRGGIEIVNASVSKVRDAVEEIHRISMGLHPATLDDLGILVTIRWFCREFRSAYPHIRVTDRIGLEEDEVPDPLKLVIFRIAQEALNNVAKHAGADEVWLELAKEWDHLRLSIRDNGRGLDPKALSGGEGGYKGIGLQSMQERAALCGGVFSVDSRPGQGTVVKVVWPAINNVAEATSAANG